MEIHVLVEPRCALLAVVPSELEVVGYGIASPASYGHNSVKLLWIESHKSIPTFGSPSQRLLLLTAAR
eukprot:3150721-Amphidinium_carterae.1